MIHQKLAVLTQIFEELICFPFQIQTSSLPQKPWSERAGLDESDAEVIAKKSFKHALLRCFIDAAQERVSFRWFSAGVTATISLGFHPDKPLRHNHCEL